MKLSDALTGLGSPIVSISSGLTVKVAPFRAGVFSSAGGTLALVANGTWFVGIDLFTGAVIALPRLGHRGWVPVARVVTGEASVTSIEQIAPVLPASRIPRTAKKLLDGQAINVLVLGSSLAEGGSGTTDWSGMLFNAASSAANYRLPGTITFNNFALGGTPNQYQLAQVGLASAYAALDYTQSGYPLTIGGKTPPNGRSTMFTGVDLVVITTLANGGDYRVQSIEPIVRNLRKMGIEVILTTDNPQGAAQVGGTGPYVWAGGYSAVTTAALYTDGPELMRIADLYNVELADTAAYVVDAVLRYPTANIYRDSIHMFAAAPAGRVGQPGGGYEVYARAIRSCVPVDATSVGTVVNSYDFNDGTVQGWTAYGPYGAVSNGGASLTITKTNASHGQWGGQHTIPAHNSGDTVVVTGTISVPAAYGGRPSIGVYNGGWGSTTYGVAADGSFTATLTATKANPAATLLFFGNFDAAGLGSYFTVDNVQITVNSTYSGTPFQTVVGRNYEPQRLPSSRVASDYKIPGDAFVILPKDERHYLANSNSGTLGASPLGAASFARRFSSAVGASEDMLTLTAGQRAAISALGVVGFSMIYYSTTGDPAVTFDVYKNNTFQKTITIGAQTISREIYQSIYTPTEQNKGDATPSNDTIDIRVTSGTLRIAALLALTFELELLPPEAASRIGSWTAKVAGGPPNMPGYGTDTAGDYAVAQCPREARRLAWIISSKPNSKPIDTWSGREIAAAQATVGVNHVRVYGNHVGPGEAHYIKLTQAQPNADQSANGYGLHIGGLIAVYDR